MAVRKELFQMAFDKIEGIMQYDSGMGPGGEHFMSVFEDDEHIFTRTFYFDEYNREHAENFIKKVARDNGYRKACRRGSTTWARLQDAYEKHSRQIFGSLTSLGVDIPKQGRKKGRDLAMQHCKTLYERLAELFDEVDDPTAETVEEVASQVKASAESEREALVEEYEPHPPEHRITFGKHEGKTLREIAHEHPGYAEWAAGELDNRPKVRRAFKQLLEDTFA